MLASESRVDSNTVCPYLVAILLARTVGYNLFISKELVLTELHEVFSSNCFARSIIRLSNALSKDLFFQVLRDTIGKCVVFR